jgi:two-component system, chemotaxis family, chemotaxis protein CheY
MSLLDVHTINLNGVIVDSNQNFLIIDDDSDIRSILQDFLTFLGFNGKIHLAQNILEAKKNLKYEKVDYILSDWNLPDGEGIALLKAIRKSPKFKHIPFMMITAQDDLDSMILSSQIGSSEYLSKPFDIETFKQKLAEGWKTHLISRHNEVTLLQQQIERLEKENAELREKLSTFQI